MELAYKWIFAKNRVLSFIVLSVLLLFHTPLELLLSNTIVKYVLSYVLSSWYDDIVFICIIVLSILLIITRFKKYKASNNTLFFLLILSLIYLIYRIKGDVWSFTSFKILSQFKYADTIIIIFICNLFLYKSSQKTNKKDNINSFLDDEPIGFDKNDELGYTSYAKILSAKIKESTFKKSFAIGINGKWGLGKTSFIDLLRREVNGDDIIEIEFNAWKSSSPKAIIQDFFETIQNHLRPYHSSLARLLILYSNKLLALNDNKITQSIHTSVSAITGFDSLESLYKNINSSLKEIDKKIIIYIDDVDRLDKDEVIEIIRLIRNTANFHNTIFIVAYDRDYVISSLKEHNSYKGEQFLEKIFQLEITLPHFKRDVFRYKLASNLKEKFPSQNHKEIEEEILGNPVTTPLFFNSWLENMRDVTRLSNTLILNYSKLIGEVDFGDFLRLELLHLKYPSVHQLLYTQTTNFFTSSKSSELGRYILTENNDKDKKKCLESYLNDNCSELSVPKTHISKIMSLIEGIFNNSVIGGYYSRKSLSVAYPSKFNRYFAYALFNDVLSEVEFNNARALNSNDFNKKITEWVDEELEFEVGNRITEIKDFENKEDFEKIITAIFHLANLKAKKSNGFSRRLIGYDGKDLINKISNYNNRLVMFYPETGLTGLKQFIQSLFNKAQKPYSFESTFVKLCDYEYTENLPLKKEDFNNLAINYFRKYCEEKVKIDDHIWDLFHNCTITNWVATGNNSYSPQKIISEEAKNIMKEFISKDFNDFLFQMIDFSRRDDGKYVVSKFPITLFGSMNDFKKILEKESEEKWSYLKEFKNFFALCELDNFSKYVDNFKFVDIPISKRS
ncbi:MAG: KAP family P-loop NTPase fold protein [Bacteroidia bacterium]